MQEFSLTFFSFELKKCLGKIRHLNRPCFNHHKQPLKGTISTGFNCEPCEVMLLVYVIPKRMLHISPVAWVICSHHHGACVYFLKTTGNNMSHQSTSWYAVNCVLENYHSSVFDILLFLIRCVSFQPLNSLYLTFITSKTISLLKGEKKKSKVLHLLIQD